MKASRNLFNISLLSPNDNSLAQAEWAKSRDVNISIPKQLYNISNPFEALAIESFEKSEWNAALAHCKQWLIDLPYSKRPVTMGTYIAVSLVKRHDLAEELCNIGLQINPNNPDIINNYCYLLGINNRSDEAFSYMNKLATTFHQLEDNQKIVLQATTGLLYYRKGFHDTGREAYKTALQNCKNIDDDYLYKLGLLNFLREEVLAQGPEAEALKAEAIELFKKPTDYPDVEFLKNEVFAENNLLVGSTG